MRGIRRRLGTRIGLPRWFLWAFLGAAALGIVYVTARNWEEWNTGRISDAEVIPALPELLSPLQDDVVTPPVTLRWVLPLGPGPVQVRVLDPSGKNALTQTCLVDSLVLGREVLHDAGPYTWRVVPAGAPPRSCPQGSFSVDLPINAPAS